MGETSAPPSACDRASKAESSGGKGTGIRRVGRPTAQARGQLALPAGKQPQLPMGRGDRATPPGSAKRGCEALGCSEGVCFSQTRIPPAVPAGNESSAFGRKDRPRLEELPTLRARCSGNSLLCTKSSLGRSCLKATCFSLIRILSPKVTRTKALPLPTSAAAGRPSHLSLGPASG